MSETTATELLGAIRSFLKEEVLPQLDGISAYNTRIAANSLGIIGRQLQLGGELEQLDASYAAKLGLAPQDGPFTAQLALKLRDGSLQADAGLMDYLRQRTLKTLEIDNPKYSGYIQARQRWGNEETTS